MYTSVAGIERSIHERVTSDSHMGRTCEGDLPSRRAEEEEAAAAEDLDVVAKRRGAAPSGAPKRLRSAACDMAVVLEGADGEQGRKRLLSSRGVSSDSATDSKRSKSALSPFFLLPPSSLHSIIYFQRSTRVHYQ